MRPLRTALRSEWHPSNERIFEVTPVTLTSELASYDASTARSQKLARTPASPRHTKPRSLRLGLRCILLVNFLSARPACDRKCARNRSL